MTDMTDDRIQRRIERLLDQVDFTGLEDGQVVVSG